MSFFFSPLYCLSSEICDSNYPFDIVKLFFPKMIFILIWFIVFNVTFSNISAITWRPDLVVAKAGVPGENHRPWAATGKLYHLWLRVECTLFCNLQSRARTHAVLVIGLYELLGNPTNYLTHWATQALERLGDEI